MGPTQWDKESEHLAEVYRDICRELLRRESEVKAYKETILETKQSIWEEGDHTWEYGDTDAAVDVKQSMDVLKQENRKVKIARHQLNKLERLKQSPYFGRIDFMEKGFLNTEKIYIGITSFFNEEGDILIYDWRAPVSGIFYDFELGPASYQCLDGLIEGTVSLKRQYRITEGRLDYMLDTSIKIDDELLQEVLSKNTDEKMRNIVTTIQKEQNRIIRDENHQLLMVQGVAGSGKTSVALHRVAYLMYQGLSSKLASNNIAILSPSSLFAQYISNVLPELGEDHVATLAFEDICHQISGRDLPAAQTRNQFFEKLITCTGNQKELMKSSMEFKASHTFVTMLNRLVIHYERKLIPFRDVYYNHRQIFGGYLLKAQLLKRDTRTPVAIRLKQTEAMILQKVREENKTRITALERFMDQYPEHTYESKEFARMLSIRENRALLFHIHEFTEIDYAALYHKIFHDRALFYILAKGLELPGNIEEIRRRSDERLSHKTSQYEDALAIAFLKIKMAGCNSYKNIKQVIVDEAQDYYPIHFEILNALFPKAKYTVLGDVNQTIEKQASLTFYEDVQRILEKKTSALLTLSKSFRCTNEIIAFSTKFIDRSIKQECFSRHGISPEIIAGGTQDDLDQQLAAFIQTLTEQGFKSVCILCKSLKGSAELHGRIKDSLDMDIILMDDMFARELSGIFITPIYLAKGLEFDAVMIYDVDDTHYRSVDDRKLLYIASTRALHRLALFYTGKPSRFLSGGGQEDAL